MSTKENNLKEKFKIALTSTAKVIADDFHVKKTNSEEKKIKEFNFLEIDNLTSPADFIRLRAETDSSALKKKFVMKQFIKKTFPQIHLLDLFIISLKKYVMRLWEEKC